MMGISILGLRVFDTLRGYDYLKSRSDVKKIGIYGIGSGAIISYFTAALEKGVAPRVEIGGFEQAKPYIDMGVRHFCVGWDTSVIAAWCKQQADGMTALLK
jgi:hypothetical protein